MNALCTCFGLFREEQTRQPPLSPEGKQAIDNQAAFARAKSYVVIFGLDEADLKTLKTNPTQWRTHCPGGESTEWHVAREFLDSERMRYAISGEYHLNALLSKYAVPIASHFRPEEKRTSATILAFHQKKGACYAQINGGAEEREHMAPFAFVFLPTGPCRKTFRFTREIRRNFNKPFEKSVVMLQEQPSQDPAP